MDTRIYVMTHKKIDPLLDPIYIPLQVGKAKKEDFGYLGDDTGDQISEKNAAYCELTGIYWLWKNADCDNIGICHYRRYFTRDEKLLDRDVIEHILQEYPILIPNTSCVNEADAYRHYAKKHYAKDLDICREVIGEKYPDYLVAFDFAMQTILVSIGNMWITKKSIFDRYCAWLFDILFEAERRISVEGYDDYQKRVFGFLSERLFRVWLLMQPEAITEEPITLAEPLEFSYPEKKMNLLYRYVQSKVEPVFRCCPAAYGQEALTRPSDLADMAGGKIPVWVCLWQGEAGLPDSIRCSLNSLRQSLPPDQAELRCVTLENCMEYVGFTEMIIQKYNDGEIPAHHLSDILMAELLYRYGGMWIDASYFVSRALDAEIFARPLFTLRHSTPGEPGDIAKGRWSGDLWCIPKGNKLFWVLMQSLWHYWETEHKLADPHLTDYIIAAAVDAFPDIRDELERGAYPAGDVFKLHQWMNQRCSRERLQELKMGEIFYKLDQQAAYRKKNMAGQQTLYGYLSDFYSTEALRNDIDCPILS